MMEPTQECKLYKGCGLSVRPRTRARKRAPANARPHSTFTLRLLSLVACKFTVVGGRGFTGPRQNDLKRFVPGKPFQGRPNVIKLVWL